MLHCVLHIGLMALFTITAASNWDTNMLEDRNTIIHLFEWKFSDIANECEQFLQHAGYGGVQVSPVSENAILNDRPWWERYEPISYIIATRSGNEAEFIDMVERCNNVGIRIYVDIVLSHMTGSGTIGTGGSVADPFNQYFPAVPYQRNDFLSSCSSLPDYNDAEFNRDCSMPGMNRLNLGTEHVRFKLADFANRLIDMGVAGFHVISAKHIWPQDLEVIFSRLNNLNTDHGFAPGSRPYIYQEVIYMGGEVITSSEYIHLGTVTEFRHSAEIGRVFRRNDRLAWLSNWGTAWGFLDSQYALIFVDNYENQRGHGAGGDLILTHKQPREYKMATAFMLAHPYGSTKIMSSYEFDNFDEGPPTDDDFNIISPDITSENDCGNGWICEHRWRPIYNMIGFKNAVKETDINNWWSNGDQQIAFCRGNKGFIAFTNGGSISQSMNTCLPSGTYCDVISGGLINGSCTGKSVTVDASGYAFIELMENEEDGTLAIHVNAKL